MSQCLICLKRNNVKNMGVCGVEASLPSAEAPTRGSEPENQPTNPSCVYQPPAHGPPLWQPSVPASRHFRYIYIQYSVLVPSGTVDFWIMYKYLQIHAMRVTFHIVFLVRI